MPSCKLTLRNDLPFIEVQVRSHGKTSVIDGVLVDTGSASSCFEADLLMPLGVLPADDAILQLVRGIGGVETVYPGLLETLIVADYQIHSLPVDIGRLAYGFGINAILGMDFLIRAGAVIDVPARIIHFTQA